ncbi:hypothetical protein [Novosphingobium terrae]|uniref:hypothetical protein n=1 Tax=Novosphingobium terrae TaxID=2726189 RepID=UPI001980B849|nr:hypothetical protein [Novosphingobium terrae]
MAIILYQQAGVLPAGRLRAKLAEALPLRRWICGEEDDGSPNQSIPLRGHHLICGRGEGAPLFVELRCIEMPYAGDTAPPHCGHVTLSPPTTDDPAEADQVTALIADALMGHEGGGLWCRLSEGSGWMAAAGMEEVLRRVAAGEPLQRAGTDPHRPSPATRRAVAPAFHTEVPRTDRLPTLALLIAPGSDGRNTPPPPPGWALLVQHLDALDPDGDWSIDPRDDSAALLTGRPGRIGITLHKAPLPAEWLQLAQGHSDWPGQPPDTAALRWHTACLTLTCDLETGAAGPHDTAQVARAMAAALLLLGQDLHSAGRLAALANPAHAKLFPPQYLPNLAETLEADEVPVQLFISTAIHTTTPGAVSLSTTGLMPFLDHEVEAWNAPGDAETLGEKLGKVLRQLLIQEIVPRHGDTLGSSPVRILHGTSRAERPYAGGKPIPALWLEFGEARPYPSRPAVSAAAPLRRPGGFGRKGL